MTNAFLEIFLFDGFIDLGKQTQNPLEQRDHLPHFRLRGLASGVGLYGSLMVHICLLFGVLVTRLKLHRPYLFLDENEQIS
jgi:hypothetical protein